MNTAALKKRAVEWRKIRRREAETCGGITLRNGVLRLKHSSGVQIEARKSGTLIAQAPILEQRVCDPKTNNVRRDVIKGSYTRVYDADGHIQAVSTPIKGLRIEFDKKKKTVSIVYKDKVLLKTKASGQSAVTLSVADLKVQIEPYKHVATSLQEVKDGNSTCQIGPEGTTIITNNRDKSHAIILPDGNQLQWLGEGCRGTKIEAWFSPQGVYRLFSSDGKSSRLKHDKSIASKWDGGKFTSMATNPLGYIIWGQS